jgi:hypothetical protein
MAGFVIRMAGQRTTATASTRPECLRCTLTFAIQPVQETKWHANATIDHAAFETLRA